MAQITSRVPTNSGCGIPIWRQEDEFEAWLNGSPQEPFRFVESCDTEHTRIVQSGSDREGQLGVDGPAAGMLLGGRACTAPETGLYDEQNGEGRAPEQSNLYQQSHRSDAGPCVSGCGKREEPP